MTIAWPALKVNGTSRRSRVSSAERGVAGVALAIGTVTNGSTEPQCTVGAGHNAAVAFGRRLRGVMLRFVMNRPLAVVAGAIVMAPGVWLLLADLPWESGVTDGVALLAAATGAALLWTGAAGRQADWIDPNP